MWLVALNCLWLIPVAAYRIARRRSPARTFSITGPALGLVVSPASMGLYSLYFFSPFTAPLGIVGLVLGLFHGGPGYQIALWMGVVAPGKVVEGMQHVYTELLSGVFWLPAYGAAGMIIDYLRARKSRSRAGATQ